MRNTIIIVVALVMVVAGYWVYRHNTTDIYEVVIETQEELAENVEVASLPTTRTEALAAGPSVLPISHASMVLTWGDVTVYVDPVGEVTAYADQLAPDIVLLTDIHGDHLSAETLEGVIAGNSVLVAPQAVYEQLPQPLQAQTMVMANGELTELAGLSIEAVPMYNYPESDEAFHVKGRGNGYLLTRGDFRVYIAGDTGPTPEMKALTDIDMAFVPMNLPYTMTVDEAAEAAIAFAPTTVIPYHYRSQGGFSDVERFKTLVEAGSATTDVLLLNWYPETDAEAAEAEAE